MDELIKELVKRQNELAHGAMMMPLDERQYLVLCGQYSGFQQVLKLIDEMRSGGEE